MRNLRPFHALVVPGLGPPWPSSAHAMFMSSVMMITFYLGLSSICIATTVKVDQRLIRPRRCLLPPSVLSGGRSPAAYSLSPR
jgi:hypothetical protein